MHTHTRCIPTHVHFSQILLALTLCLMIAPVQASGLERTTIESFIASLQGMEAIFEDSGEEALDEEFEDDDMDMDFTRIYSSMVEELSNHPPTQREVSAIAKRHGFKSLAEWGRTGDRIYTAYLAITMEGQPSMDHSEMEGYLSSLESPQMPEAEIEAMRQMMEGAIKSNEAIRNAPREDIEAVRPYTEEITALHEMEAD